MTSNFPATARTGRHWNTKQTTARDGDDGESDYRRLLPADQKLCWNASVVVDYNSQWKIPPTHIIAISNENVKWYFHETSYNGWPTAWGHSQQLCLSSRRGFASAQSGLSFKLVSVSVDWTEVTAITALPAAYVTKTHAAGFNYNHNYTNHTARHSWSVIDYSTCHTSW